MRIRVPDIFFYMEAGVWKRTKHVHEIPSDIFNKKEYYCHYVYHDTGQGIQKGIAEIEAPLRKLPTRGKDQQKRKPYTKKEIVVVPAPKHTQKCNIGSIVCLGKFISLTTEKTCVRCKDYKKALQTKPKMETVDNSLVES